MSHPITPLIASVENEFKALDDIILTRIASKVGLAEEISAYLVNAAASECVRCSPCLHSKPG